jgi:hypothetical protein
MVAGTGAVRQPSSHAQQKPKRDGVSDIATSSAQTRTRGVCQDWQQRSRGSLCALYGAARSAARQSGSTRQRGGDVQLLASDGTRGVRDQRLHGAAVGASRRRHHRGVESQPTATIAGAAAAWLRREQQRRVAGADDTVAAAARTRFEFRRGRDRRYAAVVAVGTERRTARASLGLLRHSLRRSAAALLHFPVLARPQRYCRHRSRYSCAQLKQQWRFETETR